LKSKWSFKESFKLVTYLPGDRGGTVVKVAGSIPVDVIGIFH